MADIATWYEVSFSEKDGTVTPTKNIIGTGTTLNFAGVEAGEQSVIKCVQIKFSRKIAKLRFWVVNNISGTATSGGVFDDGWAHGYHIRGGNELSPLLNSNDPNSFNSSYYKGVIDHVIDKLPYGYKNVEENPTSKENFNSFVKIPQNTQFFTENPGYYQWGNENINGNFGLDEYTSENANNESWYTPYIYLVVNPPLDADGGSRTGWGYRISFLYS